MQEIAFEIDAQRVGRASGYLGGLTVERYTFTGATLPAGTRLAILTRAGVTIAAAEIAEGNAATVDTNTQEVADLLRYQPLGACESVYIALGNADTIIALIPAVMRKNWLDDEATHPPVPANRYPTKTELDEWLARFDERATAAETAKADAQEAAAQAAQSATAAQTAKTAAESAATAAQTAQGKAEAAQAAAQASAEGAQSAAAQAAQSATTAAQSAQQTAQGVATLLQGKVDAAESAKAGAEAAKTAAETAKAGADAEKAAASSSATAAANSASQAKGYADEAKASAVDTLKRKYWADGVLYSDNYNGSLAELKLDFGTLGKLFNTQLSNLGYIYYFQLWGEHKRWVLMLRYSYTSFFMFLSLDAKTITHKFYIPAIVENNVTSAGTCLTNTHFWALSHNDGELYRYELATDTLTSVTTASLGVTIDDMNPHLCSVGLVPLANGDVLYGAKYIIDKETMTVVGEVALEEGVTRNLSSTMGHIRDYAFLDADDASSATPSPIYFLFMRGMPPLWVDDRWTTDEEGKRVVTLRTIKTDDASIDLGTGEAFGIATVKGLSALVKVGSAVVRYMTIDTTQSAPNIVKVTKAQSFTYSRTLPSAFCLSKCYGPNGDLAAKDAPHVVFKSGAMLAGYFGLKRYHVSSINTNVYESAFVLPSSNPFKGIEGRGMHPGGSSEFFPLFGVALGGTTVAITGGQYGNAN